LPVGVTAILGEIYIRSCMARLVACIAYRNAEMATPQTPSLKMIHDPFTPRAFIAICIAVFIFWRSHCPVQYTRNCQLDRNYVHIGAHQRHHPWQRLNRHHAASSKAGGILIRSPRLHRGAYG
jgi:hypothetical protein